MRVLDGQVAIVTGGGHGIGWHISQALAEAGAHVVLAGRQVARLEEAASEITAAGLAASVYPVDVTDQAQVEAMVEGTVAAHGRVDLLVNNAGRYKALGPVWEVDPENWWQELRVNLFGTFLCCRATLQHMTQRRSGKIINMSGGGSLGPIAYSSAYVASKVAVVRFTETLQKEVAEYGVNTYAIIPGFVRSEMTEQVQASPEGSKWAPWVGERLEAGVDYDPKLAAKLCVFLASPAGDKLGGRFILAYEDYEEVARRVDEVIAGDLYTLRRTTLPPKTTGNG